MPTAPHLYITGAVKRESIAPYLSMLVGSFVFAVMSSLAHALGSYCAWQLVALVRVGLVLIFTVALCLIAGVPLVFFKPRSLWLRSIFGSISLVLGFYVLPRLPVSEVLTLTNTFPIWIAVLSWPVLGEKPSVTSWISVSIGVFGIVLMQQPRFEERNVAALLALLSSFSTAFAIMGLHRLHHVDVRAVVAHFSGVGTIFCLAAYALFDRVTPTGDLPTMKVIAMLLAVGLTATVGQLCLTRAFTSAPPTKVSVVGLTQIVFAMIFDVIIWHRTFTVTTLIGTILVIAPTAWLMTHRGRKSRKSKGVVVSAVEGGE